MTIWPVVRALFVRDLTTDVRYRFVSALLLADAALLLLSYTFLARVFGGQRPAGYAPLPFLLVGVALNDAMTAVLVTAATGVRHNQQSGVVKAMLVLPVTPVRLALASLAYPWARGAADFVVFLLGAAVLGLPLASINVPGAIVVLLLAFAATSVLGLAAAAFAVVFKRGDPILWTIGTASLLCSGVLYPVDVLPRPLLLAAQALPSTHALALMRAVVIDGASVTHDAGHLAALIGFSLIGLPLSCALYQGAIGIARRHGTLGQA